MKYQTGDLVRIINYPALRIKAHENFYHEIARVTGVTSIVFKGRTIGAYYLDIDPQLWKWREDWLEPVAGIKEDELVDMLKGE